MLKLESNNLVEVLNHIQLSGLWGLTSQTSGPDFNNKCPYNFPQDVSQFKQDQRYKDPPLLK